MSLGKGKEGESDVASLFAEFKREMRAELRDLKSLFSTAVTRVTMSKM